MLYHITYTNVDGSTEVGRVHADDRRLARANAAFRFGVRSAAIRSIVACPNPHPDAKQADTFEEAQAKRDAAVLRTDPTASTPEGYAAWARQVERDRARKRAAEVAWANTPADEPF